MSASASEDDSLVAQASEQHIVCNTDPGKVPEILSVPAGDTLVTKLMKHSAQKIDLDGIPMEEDLEPLAFSVLDVSLDSRPMAGNMDWNPSEHAVPEEDQTSRPMEGVTGPEPLGHSVMKLHLDSQPSRNKLKPERSEHPAPDDTPRRVVGFYDNQTVSDLLVDSNTDGSDDPVPMPAPSELAEHSTSVEHSVRLLQPEPSEHPASTPRGVVGFSDNQPVSEPTEQLKTGGNLLPKPAPSELAEQPRSDGPPLWGEGLSPGTDTVSCPLPVGLPGVAPEPQQSKDPARMDQQETTGTRPESGEAIVVGAIGSAAPWFLTGWAHEVEIEFMIDTGRQVTILSTTVFERMCIVDPTVRSALRPCCRRLASADSSPLIVQGQLELAIVFPGLRCDMLFVVANIGSDGLLGTEALQSYLPHQLDLRTGQLWADGWSTLQLHQQRLTAELDGLLTTSVVIPPDSEIVAKFSVSDIRPHGCALVEPARCLTEEYGVVVGHTLVDASSGAVY